MSYARSSSFELLPVSNAREARQFVQMPVPLYRGDPNWIRPLDRDIEAVFSEAHNPRIARGAPFQRWLLLDQTGAPAGRIAAFRHPAQEDAQPLYFGGVGFFECIEEPQAAQLLFDAAANWLRLQGYRGMEGPINFGERDRWWGLLVEGFHPPVYGMPYHLPYYRHLFENYGFEVGFKQFTYRKQFSDPPPPALVRFAGRAEKLEGYRYCCIDRKQLDRFTDDFRHIYNYAWTEHEGVKPISAGEARQLMKEIKPILDERLMWFAYHDDEPVAFFIMLPDINQIVRKLNGKFGWWQKLRFLYLLKTGAIDNVLGLVFGVVPQHQAKGIESMISLKFREVTQAPSFHYKTLDLNWIGDFNKSMQHFARLLGGKVHKTHVTYRKTFT